MAPADPPNSLETAAKEAFFLNRLAEVFRTAGRKPACARQQRRKKSLIKRNKEKQ